MSYKILLVDDEPIILSGIKFLLNWEEHDCEVVETARNGQEAMECLARVQPDIVLCDINMPVMDGITFLKTARAEYPHIVFIMLTNLEDFELVRSAMQLRAIDYVLKSQLEPQALVKVINHAIDEVKRRTKLSQATLKDTSDEKNTTELIRDTIHHVFQSNDQSRLPQFVRSLGSYDTLTNYGALQLFFDFSTLPQFSEFTQEEENRLFAWQLEIVKKLAANFFKHHVLITTNQQNTALLLFAWHHDAAQWQQDTLTFAERLNAASANVTQGITSTLATLCFTTAEQFASFHQQIFSLQDYYYATNCNYTNAALLPSVYLNVEQYSRYQSLSLNGICNHLTQKLQAKDARGCHMLFDKVMQQILTTYHHRNQATWICRELYDAFYQYATNHPHIGQAENLFYQYDYAQRQINQALTQDKMLAWLTLFQENVDAFFDNQNNSKTSVLDKACEYIQENVDKRILLQDIATYAAISPSYLSTLFKKTFHKSVVDYINESKVQRARVLIEDGQLRIYEISSALGFDNAYYFTKVFKRYTGMTPTEYQANWRECTHKNNDV